MHGWDDACKADLNHRCDVTQLCINERRAVCSVLRVVHVHVCDVSMLFIAFGSSMMFVVRKVVRSVVAII